MRPVMRTADGRLKKPPACDQCKAKRVLCHPQPIGTPCPRCAEKGLACSTTPVKRRPRGSAAARQSTSSDHHTPDPMDPLPSTTHSSHHPNNASTTTTTTTTTTNVDRSNRTFHSHAATVDAAGTRALTTTSFFSLPPELVESLVNSFLLSPHRHHPVLPFEQLQLDLKTHSFNIWSMSPQKKCLVLALMAYTSLWSTHPSVVGFGSHLDSITVTRLKAKDLREYGLKREQMGMSRFLTDEAFRLATLEHVAVESSSDNAATCWFLAYLQDVHAIHQTEYHRSTRGSGGPQVWAAAYMFHLRSLPWPCPADDIFTTKRIHWSGYLGGDMARAVLLGQPLLTSVEDERLLTGPPAPTIDECLRLPPADRPANVFEKVLHCILHAMQLFRTASALFARPYNNGPHGVGEGALNDLMSGVKAYQALADNAADDMHRTAQIPEGAPFVQVFDSASQVLVVLLSPVIVVLYGELCSRRVRDTRHFGQRELARYRETSERLTNFVASYFIDYAESVKTSTAQSPQEALPSMATIALSDPEISASWTPNEQRAIFESLRTAICLHGFTLVDHHHLVDKIDLRLASMGLQTASAAAGTMPHHGYVHAQTNNLAGHGHNTTGSSYGSSTLHENHSHIIQPVPFQTGDSVMDASIASRFESVVTTPYDASNSHHSQDSVSPASNAATTTTAANNTNAHHGSGSSSSGGGGAATYSHAPGPGPGTTTTSSSQAAQQQQTTAMQDVTASEANAFAAAAAGLDPSSFDGWLNAHDFLAGAAGVNVLSPDTPAAGAGGNHHHHHGHPHQSLFQM